MQMNLITTLLGKTDLKSSLPDFDGLQKLFDDHDIDETLPPAIVGHVYGAVRVDNETKQLQNITLSEPFILSYNPACHDDWSDLLVALQAECTELFETLMESYNENKLESPAESPQYSSTDS